MVGVGELGVLDWGGSVGGLDGPACAEWEASIMVELMCHSRSANCSNAWTRVKGLEANPDCARGVGEYGGSREMYWDWGGVTPE